MSNTKKAPTVRDPNSQFERENKTILSQFHSKEILNGVLLVGIAVSTNSTRVAHKLGRAYKGFLVVDKTATGDVWRNPADTDRPQDAIPLIASTALTISLWVF